MKIWSAKCDARVFSEKMKKASIHREIEYVVFMKSNIFASSQRPRARAHNPDAIDENFRCNTVDLPHRGILVGFIFLSSKPHRHRPELPGRCIRRLQSSRFCKFELLPAFGKRDVLTVLSENVLILRPIHSHSCYAGIVRESTGP